MKKTASKLAILAAAAAFLPALPALADSVTFSLSSASQTGAAGTTLSFIATVSAPTTNTGEEDLVSDSFNLDSPLVVDDTDFYTSFPLFLDPGDTFTGELFTVTLPAGTPAGVYKGFFEILGGEGGADDELGSVNFQVTASAALAPTPEPGTWLLLATGLAGTALLARRYRPTATNTLS